MALVDKFSKDELEDLVQNSASKREVANKLGYGNSGSTWGTIQSRLNDYGIEWKHLLKARHVWYEGGGSKPKPIEEYLVENSTANRKNVKRRLIEEGLVDNKCSWCGLTETWNGVPIKLHLDHINGVNNDNRLHNLRLLCPNCHSQTATYSGSNKKINIEPYLEEDTYSRILKDFMDESLTLTEVYQNNNITELMMKRVLTVKGLSYRRTDHGVYYRYKELKHNKIEDRRCKDCNKKISKDAERCRDCASKDTGNKARVVKNRPSLTELHNLLLTKPFTEVGKMYGVSDNAVRNWCKSYGIPRTINYYKELHNKIKREESTIGVTYKMVSRNKEEVS